MPDRDPEFMAGLNTFDNAEQLEALLNKLVRVVASVLVKLTYRSQHPRETPSFSSVSTASQTELRTSVMLR